MRKIMSIIAMLVIILSVASHQVEAGEVYEKLCAVAKTEEGVKMISYDQFMELRSSGEEYYLLDVLSSESYIEGHIPGARSFPLGEINKKTAENMLSKEDKIVVYCANFMCHASTNAAIALQDMGYKVVDYKGGLKEWKEKGNDLVSK